MPPIAIAPPVQVKAPRYDHPIDAATERKPPLAWAFMLVLGSMLLGNNIFNKVTLAVCLVYFGVANLGRISGIVFALRKNPALLLLQLWACLSIGWSVVPAVTFDIVSAQAAFFCLAVLVAQYSIDKDIDQSLKLVTFFVITVIGAFALLYPREAVSAQGFKAFYGNKNGLGIVAAICLLVILCARDRRWIDYGFGLAALVLLLLSRSKTSISLFAIVLLFYLLSHLAGKWLRRRSVFARQTLAMSGKGVLGIVYGAILALVVFRDQCAGYLIGALPYDFLTGRGELWVVVLKRTEIDLLHGLGPGSFWGAGRLSEIAQTSLLTKYPGWIDKLGSADGGYIDMIGALGFVGLALMLLGFVSNARRLSRMAGIVKSGVPMALITLFAFHNITETTAFHSTNTLWFLYLYLSFYLIFLDEAHMPATSMLGRRP
jgi:hypothetical protein